MDASLPQVDDSLWAGRYYRRIVEVVGIMEDGRLKVQAYDPKEDRVIAMALTLPEPPEVKKTKKQREHGEKPRLTPEMRQKIEDGLACAARGHDLTGSMPNGRPVLYLGPKGQRACRMCKAEAAERFLAKKGVVQVEDMPGRPGESEGAPAAVEE